MDERTLASEKMAVPRIHWMAKASCGFSICTTLVFLLEFSFLSPSSEGPLHDILVPLSFLLPLLRGLMPLQQILPPSIGLMPLYFLAFIFGGIALAISSRRQWRKGRGMAIVGALLPTILLLLYGVWILYLLYFFRHLHFVG
jgi:hypothetical protein